MVKAEEIYNKFKQDWKENKSNQSLFNDTDKTWTKNILEYFEKEGINSYDLVSHRNYLNDLVWSIEGKKEEEYENYDGLVLALESEWGRSKKQIMEDFYKLVDVKAFLKIMIIGRSGQATNEIIEVMSKIIKKGRIKVFEEEYLIIVFPQNYYEVEKEGQVFSGYKINSQGKLQTLQPYYLNT